MLTLDIVGCGEVAEQFHGPVLRHLRRTGVLRVEGCYDRNGLRARRLCGLLGAARWADTLPAEPAPGVQAVLVATPPGSHADLTLQYARAGRHALVEKPFVGHRGDADRIIAAARQAGSRVLVGHMRRFYPSVRIARDFFLAGGLGTLKQVVVTEGGRWGGWAVASNYVVADPLGGVLYDTGAHALDTLLFVLGADDDPDTQTHVTTVVRDRAEPSQDLRADFTIVRAGLGTVPVRLALSRTRALAAGVRLVGERGTLLVASGFATSPRLVLDGETFTLDRAVTGPQATDPLGAFTLEYLALADVARGSSGDTVLDARRFVTLTSLLDQLRSFSGAA